MYTTIPTSYSNVCREIIRMVDLYRLEQVSEQILADMVNTWTLTPPAVSLSRWQEWQEASWDDPRPDASAP